MYLNPFEQDGAWYKANLHTHTNTSDGQAGLETRVQQYLANGYSVLAITDHGVCVDAAQAGASGLLVLNGVEVAVRPDADTLYHLACLDVPPGIDVPAASDPNDIITWAKGEGGEVIAAHPYWSGNTLPQLSGLRGHLGIEVFNATCRRNGKAHSTVHWDNLLATGAHVVGFAVDDAHAGRAPAIDLFTGWVMLKLRDLAPAAVMDALRTGCFYSSCGPDIVDFRTDDGVVSVACTAAREIHLVAAAYRGASFYASDDRAITCAQAEIGPDWRYVRAEIVDAAGARAWSNPIYL